MSTEQSQVPQPDQPRWYGQASFTPGEQVDLHASSLESVSVMQARKAIAAAIYTAPSGSLEVAAPIETPQFKVHRIGQLVCAIRKVYDDTTLSLTEEEVTPNNMFAGPDITLASVTDISDRTQMDDRKAA